MSAELRERSGHAKNVVILDDDPLARREIASMLRDCGVNLVLDTPFGAEALQWVQGGRASLVLCDLDMPAMDGVEFIERLAVAAPRVPLVLMSGTDQKVLRLVSEIAAAYGLRVVAALTKPLRPSDIRRIVDPAEVPNHNPRVFAIAADEIPAAVRRGEFEVFYQPLVRLADGRCHGVEALVRWNHPVHGELGPRLFIPLAEQRGQMSELTHFVADRSIKQLGAWQRARRAPPDLSLAINISPLDTGTAHFAERLEELALGNGLKPAQITLEITETAVTEGPALLQFVSRAHLRGFKLAIDDFGTGHSNLHNLRRLPLDAIKIDQTFISAAVTDREARSIVETSVQLARQLGLRTVAEGVATAPHWALAEELGCNLAQGYWMAPPLSDVHFLAWVEQWQKRYGRH